MHPPFEQLPRFEIVKPVFLVCPLQAKANLFFRMFCCSILAFSGSLKLDVEVIEVLEFWRSRKVVGWL